MVLMQTTLIVEQKVNQSLMKRAVDFTRFHGPLERLNKISSQPHSMRGDKAHTKYA